jgi:lysozyme
MPSGDELRALLRLHEGLRLKPYRCPAGALTIGYGRNLDAKGISGCEAEVLLSNDLREAEEAGARVVGPAWDSLSEVRRAVCTDMAFNLGAGGFAAFRKTVGHIRAGEFEAASEQILRSRWASQVGRRASRLADMMRFDEWPWDLP